MDGPEPAPGIGLRLLDNLVAASGAFVEVPTAEQPLEAGKCQPQESKETQAEPAAVVAAPLDPFWSKPAF